MLITYALLVKINYPIICQVDHNHEIKKKFEFLSNNEKERISKTNDNIYTYRYLLIGKPVLSVKAI